MKQKNRYLLYLFVSIFILTGFTVIDADYYTYREPNWVWRETTGSAVYKYPEIKDKVDLAIKELDKKGFKMEDVKVYISPHSYGYVKGMAWYSEVVIANNSYDTIFHEFGHTYDHKNPGIIKEYERIMKNRFPDHVPKGTSWEKNIKEDFAEEFKKIFTGTPKRTSYPDFKNFEEWLLRTTQSVKITRKEAFDKLGGTEKLIKNGIVKGNEYGDYMLDKALSRAELSAVIVRLQKLDNVKETPFPDIKGKWYENYVKKIYNEGYIKGFPNKTFQGEANVTRYQLHMILDRM